jgi:hypothetical protein
VTRPGADSADAGDRDRQPHPLRLGTRVRHRAQEWAAPLPNGTAEVIEVRGPTESPNALPAGRYEYLVRHDGPFAGGDGPPAPDSWWPSAQTIAIAPPPPHTAAAKAAIDAALPVLLQLLEPAAADPRLGYAALADLPAALARLDEAMPLADHPPDIAGQSDRWRAGRKLPGRRILWYLGDFRFDWPPSRAVAEFYQWNAQQVIACLAANLGHWVEDYALGRDLFLRRHAADTLEYVRGQEHLWAQLAAHLQARRYIDAAYASWISHPPHSEARAADGVGFPRALSLRDLETRFGPLRLVIPPTPFETSRLEAALRSAGRRALTTLAAALHDIERDFDEAEPHRSHVNVLTLGEPGSWGSRCLTALVTRLHGVAPSRIDAAARAEIRTVVLGWVRGETYTEVAGNLAQILGRVIDQTGGFEQVADRWVLAHPGAAQIRGWACSRSGQHESVPPNEGAQSS